MGWSKKEWWSPPVSAVEGNKGDVNASKIQNKIRFGMLEMSSTTSALYKTHEKNDFNSQTFRFCKCHLFSRG